MKSATISFSIKSRSPCGWVFKASNKETNHHVNTLFVGSTFFGCLLPWGLHSTNVRRLPIRYMSSPGITTTPINFEARGSCWTCRAVWQFCRAQGSYGCGSKNRYQNATLKWKHGPKLAYPLLFSFEPHPYGLPQMSSARKTG